MYPKPKVPPLVVVLGETASGKTDLAIQLAKKLDCEVICADSWTVRRGVNVGTDKPTSKQRAEVPHHLLDVIDPCEDFTVAVFKTLALKSIDDISSRGKIPIIVGGSGLYIDSVIFDYGFLGPADPKQRSELNKLSLEQLIQRIHELGLPLREDIDQSNKRRLIRLIESEGQYPGKGSLRKNTLLVGVKLTSTELKEAIEKRVDQMLAKGLEKEVKDLSIRYGWDCEALKGVGYKQWRSYFENHQSLDETRQQIISATNNLAKKQRTWFKRNKSIHWFNQPVELDIIVDLVTTRLTI